MVLVAKSACIIQESNMGLSKKIASVFLCAFLSLSVFTQTVYAFTNNAKADTPSILDKVEKNGRHIINFNNDWMYKKGNVNGMEDPSYDSSTWLYVNLPHSTDLYTPENKEAYLGISCYRKKFTIPKDLKGKKLVLTFEAAMQASDVWINGKHVNTHKGGYTPFVIDISNDILYGESNTIAVKIDSRPNADFAPGKMKPGFQYWGGLYGSSFITVTNTVHVSDVLEANIEAGGGIFITAPEVDKDKAKLHIKTHVMNESSDHESVQLLTEVINKKGTVVAKAENTQTVQGNQAYTFQQDMNVVNPDLWSIYTPDLYNVRTSIIIDGKLIDKVDTAYGIRKVEWKRDGLYVNDQKMDIEGMNLHSEIYMLGNAMPTNAIYAEIKRLKEHGIDAVRMAHYPHKQAFYDACDRYGVMVIDCLSGWQYFNNTDAFKQSTYDQMRTIVRTHRNNASIVAWEPSLNESNYTKEWAQEMNRITKAEYPQNGIAHAYTAGCSHWEAWDIGLGTPQAGIFGDGVEGADHPSNKQKPIIIAEYGDWTYGGTNSSTRVTRQGINPYGIAGGESGMLTQANNVQEAVHTNHDKGKAWLGLSAFWDYADWAGYVPNMLNHCGVVDVYRLPKYSAYFYQSQRPANVDMSAYGIKSGPMVFIANEWQENSPTAISIYSNCDTVELFLNGKSLGEQGHDEYIWGPHGDGDPKDSPAPGVGKKVRADGLKNAPITFHVDKYEKGELKAVGKINGKEKATFIRNTPKSASQLNLRAEDETPLQLDGSDTKLVWIDITDDNGTVINSAYQDVTLSIEGPGIVIGEKTVKTSGGQLAVWVRSKRGSGEIRVTAKSDGLKDKVITLKTEQVPDLPQVPEGGDADESEYVPPVEPVNIFLNKPAIAKTEQETQKAIYANDGDENTKWCETGTGAPLWENALPQWWQVDLGDVYKLSEIDISMATAGKVYQYTISVSNNPDTWTKDNIVVDRRNNIDNPDMHHELRATGRYVRIEITGTPLDVNGKHEWAVLREVQGHGESTNIAYQKPASASSENINDQGVEYAAYANDNNPDTRWCAKGGAGTADHWWQVDLQGAYKLSDINIMFSMNDAAYKFDLQGSTDGVHYTSIKDFRKGEGCEQNVSVKTDMIVQYIRIYDISTKNPAKQWPCICDVHVHGEKVDYSLSSVSREKKTKASSSAEGSYSEYGSDSVPQHFWYPATLGDEWWIVDTNGFYDLDNIQFTWDKLDTHRYTIEVSTDAKTWKTIVDKSKDTKEEIQTYDKVEGTARFIKVNLLGERPTKQGFGLFDAYAPKASIRKVKKIESLNKITAHQGTPFDKLSLPDEIYVTLSDDISASLPIKWSSNDYDPSSLKEQTITGEIKALDGIDLGKQNTAEIKVSLQPAIVNVDKSALQKLYDTFKDIKNNNYTEESWKDFKQALEKAKAVLADEHVTQDVVDKTAKILNDAQAALKEKPLIIDKKELQQTIEKAEYIVKDADHYEQDTFWQAMLNALVHGKEIYASQTSTQKEIDDANLTLQKTIIALKAKPEFITSITDHVYGIEVRGLFDKRTVLSVTSLHIKELEEQIKDKTYLSKVMLEKAFDINLLLDGTKISPSGKVNVLIPLDAVLSKKHLAVIHIDENGNIQELPSYLKGDNISFDTNHFSTFAIVSLHNEQVVPPSKDQPNVAVDTGDQTYHTLYIVLLMITGTSILLFLYRKRKTS